jgi:hypothetical protein
MFASVVRKGTHVKRSSLLRGTNVGAILAILVASLASSACSSSSTASFGDGFGDDDSDASTDDGGGASGHDSGTSSGDGGGSSRDSSTGSDSSSGEDSSPGVDASTPDTSTTSPDTGTVTSDDGFGEVRTACINEINRLRATQSLPPYTLVNTDTEDMCVDEQATADEAAGVAHQSWMNNYPSAACDGNGQDECEGYGNTVAGITQCLDDMWNEKNQSDCTGCVGCTAFGGACPNCNFSGTGGQPECGHYVNMSATYFSSVACGFSAAPGTWAAQNFFQ